jgi:hypothetical protein
MSFTDALLPAFEALDDCEAALHKLEAVASADRPIERELGGGQSL